MGKNRIFFARWTPAIYLSLVSKPVSQDIQSICYCLHTGTFRLDTRDLLVAGVPISISSKYLYLYLELSGSTFIVTRPQRRSCGNVMFSQVSCVSTGGGVHPRPRQADTPWADTPGRHPPWVNTPSSKWLLQRTVCILLEYILVTACNEVGVR